MKVLFVITQSEIGGAQRYLLEFARYLDKKGYEISVAAGEGNNELFQKLSGFDPDRIGVKPRQIKIPSLVRSLNPIKDFFALILMLKIIQKENPDVLFLQSTKAGFLGSLAGKLLQKKVIYRIGGWSFRDPRAPWMNKILFAMEKISSRWKDVIIVNSEFDKNLASQKKIARPKKIVTIYNGINPEKLNFLSKEEALEKFSIFNFQFSNNTKIVGTIANLYATKGIKYLIEAAREIQATFIVIGEGKERPKLEALIKKNNLQDRFFLIGRKKNAHQYIKAFDIFVLSSVKEGFPWVLLEAMSAEVPIIATRVGAVPEIIENGKDGLLVPPKNSKTLAEKISQLLHNSGDRQSYVKNSKEKLKQFSSEKMLKESEEIINQH